MKRLAVLLICLVLAFGAHAETDLAGALSESAVPLVEILCMCTEISAFDEAPDALLACQAVRAYRTVFEEAPETDEEIYALLFAYGEYAPPPEEPEEILASRAEVDSAIDCGTGEIKLSVSVYRDYGDGFEFDLCLDIYLVPDSSSPFGARISRVFIPE
ncbi:MAG: hypothetical protein IKX84_00150 [Clostridia bacterium]|nr:hypothetical protein [Clostridia bacterium]